MIAGINPILQTFLGTLFTWGMTAIGSALVFVFRSGQVRKRSNITANNTLFPVLSGSDNEKLVGGVILRHFAPQTSSSLDGSPLVFLPPGPFANLVV